jgi:hypothetical protein
MALLYNQDIDAAPRQIERSDKADRSGPDNENRRFHVAHAI